MLVLWRHIRGVIGRWTRAEEGVAASEYAILLALIVLGSMGIIGTVGSRIAGIYSIIRDAMPEGLI
jgi:Flp pilus assembly pilin Flp